MVNHTNKIKHIYEDLQKKIYNMIPEKWEKLYLYSSIIEKPEEGETGELFFYYIPKGVLKKKPVNAYEIPNRFNLDEGEFLQLIEILYAKIRQLREEFINSGQEPWSSITCTIQNSRFRVEYNYEDLKNNEFTSYERHIIWRYKNLEIGPEQVNKQDKEILKRYIAKPKTDQKKEIYEFGTYLKETKNKINYQTEESEKTNQIELTQKEREY